MKENFENRKIDFQEKLKLPQEIMDLIGLRGFISLRDIGYNIGIEKALALYRMIMSAGFSLVNAFSKKCLSDDDNDDITSLWECAEYLKNSIIWYNSCEDYIYQILWFSYEMHKVQIKDRDAYLKALKRCKYENIIKEIDKLNTKEAKNLKKIIKNYRYDSKIDYLRNTLANNLKHRADIEFEDLYISSEVGFIVDGTDLNEVIQPMILNVEETINCLVEIHIKLVEYVRQILSFISFEDVFVLNKEGNIIVNAYKPKSEYKKIIF